MRRGASQGRLMPIGPPGRVRSRPPAPRPRARLTGRRGRRRGGRRGSRRSRRSCTSRASCRAGGARSTRWSRRRRCPTRRRSRRPWGCRRARPTRRGSRRTAPPPRRAAAAPRRALRVRPRPSVRFFVLFGRGARWCGIAMFLVGRWGQTRGLGGSLTKRTAGLGKHARAPM